MPVARTWPCWLGAPAAGLGVGRGGGGTAGCTSSPARPAGLTGCETAVLAVLLPVACCVPDSAECQLLHRLLPAPLCLASPGRGGCHTVSLTTCQLPGLEGAVASAEACRSATKACSTGAAGSGSMSTIAATASSSCGGQGKRECAA
jgi:hypothetical protein